MKDGCESSLILLAVMLMATPTTGAQTRKDDIEISVVAGLRWLATQQNTDGSFADWDTNAHTGLAILKFADRAIDLGFDPLDPTYEYSAVVQAGLDCLESTAIADANGVHWGPPRPLGIQHEDRHDGVLGKRTP
jgi:hypothetical protein